MLRIDLIHVRLLCLPLFVLFALPLAAHHSFASVFDQNKPANFTGTVTKVEWSVSV